MVNKYNTAVIIACVVIAAGVWRKATSKSHILSSVEGVNATRGEPALPTASAGGRGSPTISHPADVDLAPSGPDAAQRSGQGHQLISGYTRSAVQTYHLPEKVRAYLRRNGVPEDRQSSIEQLVSKYRADESDIQSAAKAEGLSTLAMLKLKRPSWDVMMVGLQEILGTQGANDYIDYDNALAVMPIAEDFAHRCDAAGLPISDDVVDQIAITILKFQTEAPVGAMSAEQADDVRRVKDPAAFGAAAKLLSPEQMALFSKMWSERRWIRDAGNAERQK